MSSPLSSSPSSASAAQYRIHAQGSFALNHAAMNTVQVSEECRNQNTTKAYAPKQKEFKDWCKGINNESFSPQDIESARRVFGGYVYADKDSVSDQKLNLFLIQRVVNRPRRAASKKRSSSLNEMLSLLLYKAPYIFSLDVV
jgi:hypothetical protein